MSGSRRGGTPSHERASRSPVRRNGLTNLHKRLSERDHQICDYLHEHKCLTTHQIADLFFNSPRSARDRLLDLYEMKLIIRFQPHARPGQGSFPYHYLLGPMGARLVAARRGIDLRGLGYRRELVEQVAFSPKLPHLLAVNTFFSRLALACRRNCDRLEWWSETKCARQWGSIVRPDGYGVIESNIAKLRFFLEMDRGTERPWRVAEKLPRYDEVAYLESAPKLVLFCFSDLGREVAARKAFDGCALRIATATFEEHVEEPLGAKWLVLDSTTRQSLLEVASDA
jgi:hypothetical protein